MYFPLIYAQLFASYIFHKFKKKSETVAPLSIQIADKKKFLFEKDRIVCYKSIGSVLIAGKSSVKFRLTSGQLMKIIAVNDQCHHDRAIGFGLL